MSAPVPSTSDLDTRILDRTVLTDLRATLQAADYTVDRVGVDGLLSELDEYAVEQALQFREKREGEEITVTALTVGPEKAVDAVRKSLQMGADSGVHVVDDAIAGSDYLGTSLVLAKAIEKIKADTGADLVICGMASTDAAGSVVPAMLAERLGISPASASAMVKKLDALGLVAHQPYHGVQLTPAGLKVALEVLRHHRLLELYLAEELGLEPGHASRAASSTAEWSGSPPGSSRPADRFAAPWWRQ